MFESTVYLTYRPAFPWSEGALGLIALGAVAALLVALTLWTYLGDPQASRRRIALLIGIRLAALLVAILTLLRPSLAIEEDPRLPSRLVILADASESMTVQDEFNNQTRWQALQQVLKRCEPILQELRDEQNIQVDIYRFAGDFDPEKDKYDPDGRADGPRTDFGTTLANLYAKYQSETDPIRALVILSDGADNGTRRPALAEAARWGNLSPIRTFGLGQATTSSDVRDIAVTSISPDPSPVPIKGKLTVKALVNAPGFERAKVKMTLLFDDKEVKKDAAELLRTEGNEVEITADAPTEPGEIKVTLRLEPLAGEVTDQNNTIETYVTVTREGLSVLVIDKARLEPKYIRYALASDKRIRYYEATRQTDAPPAGEAVDLFRLDEQHYDVIILGDVSAKRLAAGNPRILQQIADLVKQKGVGLMMIGGIDSFGGTPGVPGSGDWAGTPIADLLPVRLDAAGQVEDPVRMMPTEKGLAHYLLRLDPNPDANADIWRRLNDPENRTLLNGMNRLGEPKVGATVLARVDDPVRGAPLMVGWSVGEPRPGGAGEPGDDKMGRVLAFGADSTWNWLRLGVPLRPGQPVTREGVELHRRFWKQVVLWLAHQEEVEGNVWVKPEFRRLPVRGKQVLRMGLRGKSGNEIEPAEVTYQILAPGEDPAAAPERTPDRDAENKPRVLYEPLQAGEYNVIVRASGKDTDGAEVKGEATARFIVYPDVSGEMLRKAAEHDFLAKLEQAASPGAAAGRVSKAEDLPEFLRELKSKPLERVRPKPDYLPDWRRDAMPWFLPTVLVVFVTLLGLEWGLRRAWGMV